MSGLRVCLQRVMQQQQEEIALAVLAIRIVGLGSTLGRAEAIDLYCRRCVFLPAKRHVCGLRLFLRGVSPVTVFGLVSSAQAAQ